MYKMDKRDISRRDFLKTLGLAGAAVTGLSACAGKQNNESVPLSADDIPAEAMTLRTNPKTGDKVSLLGYGMMRLPSKSGKSAREGQEEIDQDMVNRLVDYAIAHGVNLFDTSPAYCRGKSEESTGIALSRYPREKYFVSTKLSNFAPSTWSREASLELYHNSLKYLRVDYLDYMLLHSVGRSMEDFNKRYMDNGVLDYLVEERSAGRIRNLGFSFHGDVKVFDHLLAQHDKYHWDFVLIQMNYVDWKHTSGKAEYLYEELSKRGIPVMVMEPLLGGRLAKLPDGIVKRLKQREPERSVASWAFRFCGTYPGVLTVLSGMTLMEHLQDNIKSYAPLKPLTEGEKDFLNERAEEFLNYKNIPCNDCKYCMPCPYGIDIPAILLHYNKCQNEGNVPLNRQSENYSKARRAYLVSYDRAVPKIRQADHCIGCHECQSHCPQDIKIPRELHKIAAYVEKLKQETL